MYRVIAEYTNGYVWLGVGMDDTNDDPYVGDKLLINAFYHGYLHKSRLHKVYRSKQGEAYIKFRGVHVPLSLFRIPRTNTPAFQTLVAK